MSENKSPVSPAGASQRRSFRYYLRNFAAMCRNGGNITTLLISVALALVVWILVRVFAYPDTTKKINGVDIQAQAASCRPPPGTTQWTAALAPGTAPP